MAEGNEESGCSLDGIEDQTTITCDQQVLLCDSGIMDWPCVVHASQIIPEENPYNGVIEVKT